MNSQNSHRHDAPLLNLGGRLVSLEEPVVMGILNATPDSFYAESRQTTVVRMARRAEQIVEEGGLIVDVGGCSTRPGGSLASEDEELARVRTALEAVREAAEDVILSVDTFRPAVARMAVEEFGCHIVNDVGKRTQSACTMLSENVVGEANDISGGEDAEMFATVARLHTAYVLTSQQPTMDGVLMELASKSQQLHAMGVSDVIADPGFGFGKTTEENFAIVNRLEQLSALGLPVLVGVSRKSMICNTLGVGQDEALNGTTALHAITLLKGARILRVHDVREAVETVKIYLKTID